MPIKQLASKLSLAAVMLGLLLTTAPVLAQEPAAANTEEQQQALTLLKRMAEFLAQAPRFSVTLRTGYDVVQESGQKIEFGEVRKLLVKRPDRLRMDVEQSDGDKGIVVFDGNHLWVYNSQENVFAKAHKSGSLDDAIIYFIKDLQMRLPLAMLLVTTLPAEIDQRVQSVDYVEQNLIMEVPCDHLAAQTETTDFQVWIAQGEQPLPRRVVITYREAEGEPQFWAELSDWNLAPDLNESMFVFTPLEGTEEISFLATLERAAPTDQQLPVEDTQGAKP
jgi:hypothetical protein